MDLTRAPAEVRPELVLDNLEHLLQKHMEDFLLDPLESPSFVWSMYCMGWKVY